VKIYAWPYFLEVQGKVCRSDSNFGVAVAFGQIESRYASVLNACLLEANRNNVTALVEVFQSRAVSFWPNKGWVDTTHRSSQ
jgi:hypothetical protein